MTTSVKVPGVAWVALAGLLATWLGQYVDAPWAVTAVTLLTALGKGLEVYFGKPDEPEPPVGGAGGPQAAPLSLGVGVPAGKARKGSTVVRWLFG